jgi:hypothetical protein
VLLIRTDNLGRFRSAGSWQGFTHFAKPGIGQKPFSRLHEREFVSVASGTWAIEIISHGTTRDAITLPLHTIRGRLY